MVLGLCKKHSLRRGLAPNDKETVMGDDYEKKTWTPQQVPPGVHGTKPTPDKEPAPEPPKPAEKR